MKRILLLTDFSENALNAIQYAKSVFKNSTVTFYLCNAYERFEMGSQNKDIAQNRLMQLVAKLQKEEGNSKHCFEAVPMVDELISATKKVIVAKEIDYLVMGTKGSSAVREIFMGSNAVRALQQIDLCPMIFVPEDYRPLEKDHILIATDFSNFHERSELLPVIDIAETEKTKLTVVHVLRNETLTGYQKTLKGLLEKRLQKVPYTMEEVRSSDPLPKLIDRFITERKISLLAMIYRRQHFFESMWKSQVVKKLVFRIKVPFLVLPESA
ncbi:universal stress protein [Spongiimicrobium salis]|uniref:universal stress protein n=1 Tax=Spongiimicrobium salis TaxID=1667022 RepID=UPI00374CEB5D